MKNSPSKFALTAALMLALTFTFSCSGGGGGEDEPLANQINGTWKADDGESITLDNGSFVVSENNKQGMRGTYTTASTNITMAIKEIHGDFLSENNDDDMTFESKWYNKNQVIDFYKSFMKTAGMTDAQISAFLAENSADFDAMFPTITGTISGGTMTLDGTTYTKEGGSSSSSGGNSNGFRSSSSSGGTDPGTNPVGSIGSWTAVNDVNGLFGDRQINAIAFGNGKFVAGGCEGKMAYSSDGVSWTAIDIGTIFDYDSYGKTYKSDIGAIAYGNNKFIAAGDRGKMAHSSDGVNWTATTNGVLSSIESIAYGNGMFVAVAEDGKMEYSSDNGLTWTKVTDSKMDGAEVITYGNNKFIAGGHYGKMAYSSDGVNWTAVTNSNVNQRIDAIAYGNNKFVAGVSMGYHGTAYSSNGVTWTYISYRSPLNDYYDISTIAYGNGKFVAGGNYAGNGTVLAYLMDN